MSLCTRKVVLRDLRLCQRSYSWERLHVSMPCFGERLDMVSFPNGYAVLTLWIFPQIDVYTKMWQPILRHSKQPTVKLKSTCYAQCRWLGQFDTFIQRLQHWPNSKPIHVLIICECYLILHRQHLCLFACRHSQERQDCALHLFKVYITLSWIALCCIDCYLEEIKWFT